MLLFLKLPCFPLLIISVLFRACAYSIFNFFQFIFSALFLFYVVFTFRASLTYSFHHNVGIFSDFSIHFFSNDSTVGLPMTLCISKYCCSISASSIFSFSLSTCNLFFFQKIDHDTSFPSLMNFINLHFQINRYQSID